MDNLSLADIKAAVGNDGDYGGCWWIILLFICLFGGGNFGWGNNNNSATTTDLQRAMDLNAIQQGQSEINGNIQRVAYEVGGMVKDASYNNLAETRDVQIALGSDTTAIQRTLSDGFTNIATNFCGTQRAIDGIKYEGAINTAAINSNIDSKFAAFEKAQLQQQIANQAAQIQQLQLNAAMCGVVRYPVTTTYTAGVSPIFGNQCCGGTTF